MATLQKSLFILMGQLSLIKAASIPFLIPKSVPGAAVALDATPVGVSFEFDMISRYILDYTHPWKCLNHIESFYDEKVPIRVGGTTQDRCGFDGNYDNRNGHFYSAPDKVPNLYFGPKLFDLIGSYGSDVIVGFNRGDNNLTNSLEAAVSAKSRLDKQLWGVEIGNEPDLYYSTWNKSVAVAPWNNSQEGANQAEWFQALINVWDDKDPILVGGNYAVPIPLVPNYPDTNYLIEVAFNFSVKAMVKMYSTHSYALSPETATLDGEMNHVKTVADMSTYIDKIETAHSAGRTYVLTETGFHGLETLQDATFGAALQIVDKSLHTLSLGVQRLYHHQGGLGTSQAAFNWWHEKGVEAPFYGGYFASLAVSGGDKIVQIDDGKTSFAQYVIYRNAKPYKAVLINTEYYSGSGKRSSVDFELTGLFSKTVKALLMTAPSSETRIGPGQSSTGQPKIGGQYFANEDCKLIGKQKYVSIKTSGGKGFITLQASEAVIVYLEL